MKGYSNKSINANWLDVLQVLTGKTRFYEDGYAFIARATQGSINKVKISSILNSSHKIRTRCSCSVAGVSIGLRDFYGRAIISCYLLT